MTFEQAFFDELEKIAANGGTGSRGFKPLVQRPGAKPLPKLLPADYPPMTTTVPQAPVSSSVTKFPPLVKKPR